MNASEKGMHVDIDLVRCDTTGRCVMICPQVFRFHTGHKKAEVIQDPVPERFRAEVMRAVEECPRNAITVENAE